MKHFAAALSLCLLAAANAALADQVVTLQVPVQVQNLHPEIAKISVGCFITPTSAYGRTDLPVVNRAFNGTVQVKVTVNDGNAAVAKGYRCELFLFPQNGTGYKPSQNPSATPQAMAQTGAPFTQTVEGLLPATAVTPRTPSLKATPIAPPSGTFAPRRQ